MLHADLRQRVAIATSAMAWTERDGGHEKLLELAETRDGLRHTALLQLAAGAALPIARGGCIDLLVLDGELRAEDGLVLRTGRYLHAPAAPLATTTACTLFLKQRPGRAHAQRPGHAHEQPAHAHTSTAGRTIVDTTTIAYEPGHTAGLWRGLLYADHYGDVVLLGFDPGTTIDRHRHDRGEEFFVLAGEIEDELGRYGVYDWVRQPADSVHRVASPGGCLFFTFAHHL